jgi:hypothetical protein
MLRRKQSKLHLRNVTSRPEPTYHLVSPTWDAVMSSPRPSDSEITPFIESRTLLEQSLYRKVLAFKLKCYPSRVCTCGKQFETIEHILYSCKSSQMVIESIATAIQGALNLKDLPILKLEDLIYFFPTLRKSMRLNPEQLYKLVVIHACALDAIWYGRSYMHYPIEFSSLSFKTRLQARITVDLSKISAAEEIHQSADPTSPTTCEFTFPPPPSSRPPTLRLNTAITASPVPLQSELASPTTPTLTIRSNRSSQCSSIFSSSTTSGSLVTLENPRAFSINSNIFYKEDNKWENTQSSFISLEDGLARFTFWE